MGDNVILIFKQKPKRPPHPLFTAYWDFWNPFFAWQQQMFDDHINAPTIYGSTDGDCA